MTVLKLYRPQLWVGWALTTLGMGTLCLIRADSPISWAIGLPILPAVGAGITLGEQCGYELGDSELTLAFPALTYFPVLSPLPVTLNAQALSLFAFLRAMAQVSLTLDIRLLVLIVRLDLGHLNRQRYFHKWPRQETTSTIRQACCWRHRTRLRSDSRDPTTSPAAEVSSSRGIRRKPATNLGCNDCAGIPWFPYLPLHG